MSISENLDAFLEDFGVAISSGSTSGLGILSTQDELVGNGAALSTEYAVECKTSLFGSLEFGDSMTVDGASYTVREVRKLDDGSFCRISLSKV